MSKMICVEQSKVISDPNIDVHPFPNVTQALRVVVVENI